MTFFVGDSPSPKMIPGAKAFQGAACEKRLMEWIAILGVTEFSIINSSEHELRNLETLSGAFDFAVVALGNNASTRLNQRDLSHFKLPHPSGRNRQLNDKTFVANRLKACKTWLCAQ